MNLNDVKKKVQGNAQAMNIISKASKMYNGTTASLKQACEWADKHVRAIMPDLSHTILTAVIVMLIVQMLGLAVLTLKTIVAVLLPIAGIVITAYVVHELTGYLLTNVSKKSVEVPAPATA